jgi:sugar transferase (PEP-CTERM system associated)
MRLFNRYFGVYDLWLLAGDVVLTVVAALGSRGLVSMVLAEQSGIFNWTRWIALAVMVTCLIVVCFYYADLYEVDQTLSRRELTLRFANGFGFACLIVGTVSYLIQEAGSQNIYLVQMSLLGFALFAWRLLFLKSLKKVKIRGKLLIVGMQTIGKEVSEALFQNKHLGLKVIGFIGSQAGEVTLSYGNPRRITLPVFPKESLLATAEANAVNRILIADTDSNCPGQELVALRLNGIPVEDCHTFYERLMSKISVTDLNPGWIARSTGFRRTRWLLATKRLVDVIGSAVGLALAAPVMLVTAVAIKLESQGPVFYRQERLGKDEKPFNLYKFRSMLNGAETDTGPIWARPGDPRVTRVGRIIRTSRIDEIPQMLNVLNGEMSFVGPRPERPFFVASLKKAVPYYHLRFAVKPGITGWAQISYKYGDNQGDATEKLQYELYYIKHLSLLFDLQILFETVKVVLLRRGAR